jgi:hypothetical protein
LFFLPFLSIILSYFLGLILITRSILPQFRPLKRDVINIIELDINSVPNINPLPSNECFMDTSLGDSRISELGITTGYGLEFESRWGQEFSLLYVVQTGSGAHPAPYTIGTESYLPWGKAALA